MNAEPDPASQRLADAVDRAYTVVVDPQGTPGRRIFSLHTSVMAATAVCTTLGRCSGKTFSVVQRDALHASLISELDQLVMAIKHEPDLLAMPAEQLAAVDSFTIHEAREFGISEDMPELRPSLEAKATADLHVAIEKAIAMRVAEQLFVRGYNQVMSTPEDFAKHCCESADVFAKAWREHYKPTFTP